MTTSTSTDPVETRTGPVLTSTDAAEYVGIEVQTLYNLRAAGSAPKAFKHGRKTVYYPSDLDAWLRARLVAAPAHAEVAS